ncbi:hypothetical protein BDEG_26490 [Batrachochytrium dendrobatidis JEL423]|uniref:Uncharacterized protein n=1 Tax=Batrachochytrium dendrobatidis (strain JEL423) TaxID=403673 RepID=A0A177WSJ4_BATDL|nr:hypothetical protein BDEG_26490 [Batrachochytrium dendrobatidis JEL423]
MRTRLDQIPIQSQHNQQIQQQLRERQQSMSPSLLIPENPHTGSPATNSTTSPTSPPFTSVRSSQSLLTPPASFNTLLRAPQPTLWSSAVSAHSGTSISSGSASIDSSTSMPAMIFNGISSFRSSIISSTRGFYSRTASLDSKEYHSQVQTDLPPEIMSMQINLSNPVITFRGVNQGHLLDNDLASLQGHVYVHFKDPLMSLARVRLRIVGEEFVRAFSDRSKPSKLRGIFEHHIFLNRTVVLWEPMKQELMLIRSRELRFKVDLQGNRCPPTFASNEGSVSYRVEVLLDIREEPNELNNWKSGGNIEMVACLSDFRVQRVPTFSELKIYSKPTTISKLQVNCFVTGSRIILAHQAGPKNFITVTPCRVSIHMAGTIKHVLIDHVIVSLVERTKFLGRKSSLLAKVKPEFKSYVRDRNVLGAREIPREAIGPRILLDLYDISAAQVLNQTMFGKHLEVSHHLAVEFAPNHH